MSDFGVLKSSEQAHKRYYHPQSNVYLERRPSSNKQLPQICEFSERALTEQTNPLREQESLCADILMHERTEHERKMELYVVLFFYITAVYQSLHNIFKKAYQTVADEEA